MKLIAKQPCSFGGKRFYIGDEIPLALVKEPKTQEKYGILAIVDEGEQAMEPADSVEIIIRAKEGDMPLNLTKGGLQAAVDVLTGTTDDAEPIIKAMSDGDALILIHLIDNRKTVKAAAEARAKELNPEEPNTEESAGEQ